MLDAFLRLHENGTFIEDAEEIMDMVFDSPLYTKDDLIRCFQTEKDQHVALLLQYLSEPERALLRTLLTERLQKLNTRETGKPPAKKGDEEGEDPDVPDIEP